MNKQILNREQLKASAKSSRTYSDNLINSGDITIGISLKDLAKHMLVVGTPGSGKTTFSVGLLDRLWKEHHIPFLVIEPAKNAYRALVQSIPDLQVFTPGKNFISPFVFNPFVPPKNVKPETYKSTLKTAFAAAVSMQKPPISTEIGGFYVQKSRKFFQMRLNLAPFDPNCIAQRSLSVKFQKTFGFRLGGSIQDLRLFPGFRQLSLVKKQHRVCYATGLLQRMGH